jgi:hypothetical protein
LSIINNQCYSSKPCKRAPVHQRKTSSNSNKHRHINAKADNNEYQDYKSRQQFIPGLFVHTIIYQPITIILERFVQTSNLVEPEVFSFFSPFEDLLTLTLCSQPQLQLLAHTARLHFTRNVSKPVYHYWLNSWLVYSTSLTSYMYEYLHWVAFS